MIRRYLLLVLLLVLTGCDFALGLRLKNTTDAEIVVLYQFEFGSHRDKIKGNYIPVDPVANIQKRIKK